MKDGDEVAERRFTPEFQAQVVLGELTVLKTKAEVYRAYRLKPEVFPRWRAEFLERAPESSVTRPSGRDEQQRMAELERMAGRLTLALEAAKEASAIWGSLSSRSEQ